MLFGKLTRPSQPTPITVETLPSEISSTADALTRLRVLKKNEESQSSGSQERPAPSKQQLEEEAAPLEEAPEEKVEAKIGKDGQFFMCFKFVLLLGKN